MGHNEDLINDLLQAMFAISIALGYACRGDVYLCERSIKEAKQELDKALKREGVSHD